MYTNRKCGFCTKHESETVKHKQNAKNVQKKVEKLILIQYDEVTKTVKLRGMSKHGIFKGYLESMWGISCDS